MSPETTDTSSENLQRNLLVLSPAESYDDRVTMVELLRERYSRNTGDDWPDALDGTLAQTVWQRDSLRGFAGENAVDEEGRLTNWWANTNWAVAIWPFLVAQQRDGRFNDVRVELPGGDHSYPPADAADAIERYLEARDELDARVARTGESASEVRSQRADLQALMWDYHSVAARFATDRGAERLQHLPPGEREFARAWGETIIHILDAINAPTDSQSTAIGQSIALPARMLTESDFDLSRSTDLPTGLRASVRALVEVHNFERRWRHPIRRSLGRLDDERAQRLFFSVIDRGGDVTSALLRGVDEDCVSQEEAQCSEATFNVVVGALRVDGERLDGTSWDGEGDQADPFVQVWLENGEEGRTDHRENVTTTRFDEMVLSDIPPSDLLGNLTIEVRDNDRFRGDDSMVRTEVEVRMEHLASGTLVVDKAGTGSESALYLEIEFRLRD